VRLGLVVVVSIAVLRMNRDTLAIGATFPELRRFPLIGGILGAGR